MIINQVISKLRFAAIICAIAAQITNFSAAQATAPLTPQEHALLGVINRFMDINHEKSKKLCSWANEITTIVNQHPEAPKFRGFCDTLEDMVAKKEKNVARFGLSFNKFKELLPATLKTELENIAREKNLKLKQLKAIFAFRLAVQ